MQSYFLYSMSASKRAITASFFWGIFFLNLLLGKSLWIKNLHLNLLAIANSFLIKRLAILDFLDQKSVAFSRNIFVNNLCL